MRNIFAFTLIGLALLTTVSCEKEEVLTPAQMLEGKWTITSQEILATEVPGDGSYLQFSECPGSCSGADYKASDTTSGTFTYILNEEGTLLTIDDQSADGGSWSADWDVLELTENNFRITTSTILGNLKVEMSK